MREKKEIGDGIWSSYIQQFSRSRVGLETVVSGTHSGSGGVGI
jgi:hypothetical protein